MDLLTVSLTLNALILAYVMIRILIRLDAWWDRRNLDLAERARQTAARGMPRNPIYGTPDRPGIQVPHSTDLPLLKQPEKLR